MNKKILIIHRIFYYSMKCKENPINVVNYIRNDKGTEIKIFIGAIIFNKNPLFFMDTYMITYKVFKGEESLVYGV